MHYLILDTDTWLNSLKDSGEEDNFIDAIEFWVENRHVTILLPEIIIREWERNRENKKAALIKDWRKFLNLVQQSYADIVSILKTPDNLNKLAEEQLQRIEQLFSARGTVKIPITDQIRIMATLLAEAKKQPWGDKNSIGDAYIFLAMTNYIRENKLLNCVFITNNHTDFSSKADSGLIHRDMEEIFTELQIKYYVNVGRFLYEYKSLLPDYSEAKKLKALAEEDKKLGRDVVQPDVVEGLENFTDAYIDNINHLDIILKKEAPTKDEVAFALRLIEKDDQYKEHFFKNVTSAKWFTVLKAYGYFSVEQNPPPIHHSDGIELPVWPALWYLQKIASQIASGKETQLIVELIAIVEDLSAHPKENNRTWLMVIRILSQLPNVAITESLLSYLPVWMSGVVRVMQGSELCESLLPKFLPDEPSTEDVSKARLILKQILSIERIQTPDEESLGLDYYFSRVPTHDLRDVLTEERLQEKITSYLSTEAVLLLSRQVKKLLQYPKDIQLALKSSTGTAPVIVRVHDINIKLYKENADKSLVELGTVQGYDTMATPTLLENIAAIFVGNKIADMDLHENRRALEGLKLLLTWDLNSVYDTIDIEQLHNEIKYGDGLKEIYTLILRNWLLTLASVNQKKSVEVMMVLKDDPYYRFPFFKRLLFYVIDQHYSTYKELLWQMIDESDTGRYFSDSPYELELKRLVTRHHADFSEYQVKLITGIIENGPKDEQIRSDEKYVSAWKRGWLRALEGKTPRETTTPVSQAVKPLWKEQLLQMDQEQIDQYVSGFKSSSSWEEGNAGNVADALGKAIIENPVPFVQNIHAYRHLGYIYVYHMLNGFRDAWHQKQQLDWEKIFNFVEGYISDTRFNTPIWKVENDGWGADAEWVVRAAADLISEAVKHDHLSFDATHLPTAKRILMRLAAGLQLKNNFDESKLDGPTYLLNSTAGKVLVAILECALREVKTKRKTDPEGSWESNTRQLLENAKAKNIVDVYILEGMFYEQLYFIDPRWILEQIENNYDVDELSWKAFISGLAYGSPAFKPEVYQKLKPHYERIIERKLQLRGPRSEALVRHFVAMYLWEYEDLSADGLIVKFFDESPVKQIIDFISFIRRQEKYINSLKPEELAREQKAILALWQYLSEKFSSTQSQEYKEVLPALLYLSLYIEELDETITKLIKTAMQACREYTHEHFLLEDLTRLAGKGRPTNTAFYLAQILSAYSFGRYIYEDDQEKIQWLIEFLYQNDQKQKANEICNIVTRNGHTFLKELYNKYNAGT